MFKGKVWLTLVILAVLSIVALVACEPETEEKVVEVTRIVVETVKVAGEPVEVTRVVTETEVVEVTAEAQEEPPAPPTDLIICVSQEPETLYLYGSDMISAAGVMHALYEDPYLTQSFGYQPFGLEKLPSLEDGDAVIDEVEVAEGDIVADAAGNVVTLNRGATLKDIDGNEFPYEGGSVTLPQMVVDFTFNPMVFEDGEPVTADDSVYSFDVAAHPDTPTSKFRVERTESYEATDDLSLRWTGIPGWVDATYFVNVWWPLPQHAWIEYSAAELLEVEAVNRAPLSYGPYRVEEWVAGDSITLVKNENYWREGYPKMETVTFKFIPDTNQLLAQLLSGQCDIATQDGLNSAQAPFLIEAENQGLLIPYFQVGTLYEHIDLGVNPIEAYAETRPDWFEDVRVRQAMTMCTDRQGMVDTILSGRSEVIHTYIPRTHPLYPDDGLTEYSYDVEQANALLDDVGFIDRDGDGIREYYAGDDLAGADSQWDGTPFAVTLATIAGNEMREQLSQIFQANMGECGIQVELDYFPSSEFFASGPEGPIFGRRFDLAEFYWATAVQPPCELYHGDFIPGPPEALDEEGNPLYPMGWGGQNESGWALEEYDRACTQALGSLPGSDEYEEYHKEAQRLFSEYVPVIPLFLRLKVAAARPDVRNFGVDPTQNSELYNIYEISLAE